MIALARRRALRYSSQPSAPGRLPLHNAPDDALSCDVCLRLNDRRYRASAMLRTRKSMPMIVMDACVSGVLNLRYDAGRVSVELARGHSSTLVVDLAGESGSQEIQTTGKPSVEQAAFRGGGGQGGHTRVE